MKRVLANIYETGRICDVVEPGMEYEVHPDFFWLDCDNDLVTKEWTYSADINGVYTFTEFSIVNQPVFQAEGYKIARMIAYQDIGDQLDMIYKELMANGTLSATGDWATHITTVKNTIPKDDPQAVLDWYDATNNPTV